VQCLFCREFGARDFQLFFSLVFPSRSLFPFAHFVSTLPAWDGPSTARTKQDPIMGASTHLDYFSHHPLFSSGRRWGQDPAERLGTARSVERGWKGRRRDSIRSVFPEGILAVFEAHGRPHSSNAVALRFSTRSRTLDRGTCRARTAGFCGLPLFSVSLI
jgi:hypothetical protein